MLAVHTKTGKTQAEKVAAVLVHHDTDLYNLTVKSGHRTEVIDTTRNHLFWDPRLKQWRPASKLKKGERLKTANGVTVVADGGTTPKVRDGWMPEAESIDIGINAFRDAGIEFDETGSY